MPIIYTSANLPNSYGGYTNGAWGTLMNTYGRRFTPGSGSGNAFEGVTFSFSVTVNFPYPGTYTVQASCDNFATLNVAGNNCSVAGFRGAATTQFYANPGNQTVSGTVRNGSGSDYSSNPYAIAFTIDAPSQPPAPTGSISINKSSIIAGQDSAILSWSSSGFVDSVSITNIGNVAGSGSQTISPSTTTIYTLTVSGAGGSRNYSAQITVYQPVSVSMSSIPASIIAGGIAQLTWVTSGDADTASIDQGIGAVLLSSSKNVSPNASTTYTLSASGPGGSDTDSATVTVYQRPTLSASVPLTIDYEGSFTANTTTTYANSGVSASYIFNYLDGSTDTAVVNGSANGDAVTPGISVTQNLTTVVPWNDFGPSSIIVTFTATGDGGIVNQSNTINVNIDQLPDNITLPENLDEIPEDIVEAPDEETVVSDPIVVTGIDIPVTIKSNFPIQVRFDNDDPDIESNWNDVQQI
jgi:hypothetical protein